jgi:hypothetical protein
MSLLSSTRLGREGADDCLALGVHNADGVHAVIKGESGGSGRWCVFHGSGILTTTRKSRLLPSHLFLFGMQHWIPVSGLGWFENICYARPNHHVNKTR